VYGLRYDSTRFGAYLCVKSETLALLCSPCENVSMRAVRAVAVISRLDVGDMCWTSSQTRFATCRPTL